MQNHQEFKQFDLVSDDTNSSISHHYATPSSRRNHNSSSLTKKIMQEWKILQKNLPDTIYVRAYEGRIDLLRAVIVGASGTPYHDGLYFFDIQFPPDYPNEPPRVYYHSFGFRCNPNLYANGYVCLSLLNTWSGKKIEKWNPEESSVYQVLVSIQGLVLNSKPYFNEPINGIINPSWKYWEKKSYTYNQDIFLLNCKTMLCVLNKPPDHFQELVARHFCERAESVLNACVDYMNGRVKIGDSTAEPSSSSGVGVSKKFKMGMDMIYPKLVGAFVKNGSVASLENFFKPRLISTADVKSEKKKENVWGFEFGVLKKFYGKMKKILKRIGDSN